MKKLISQLFKKETQETTLVIEYPHLHLSGLADDHR